MRNSVLGNIVLVLVSLPENFLGAVYDLMEKFTGKNGAEWFEAFKKFLRKENPWVPIVREWKVWKTIRLGTGLKAAEQFCGALEAYGFKVSEWAEGLMMKPAFIVATLETEVDLVVVSVSELGYEDGATLKEIYTRAVELGLSLCPAEVGPQLRLQYRDQPMGERLRVAMKAITIPGFFSLDMFMVVRDSSKLCLFVDDCRPGSVWRGDCRFVFVLPRK